MSGAAAVDTKTALGCLYLVGTPIGNLEDITLRALRILKEVDQIACEDTRHTQKLLNHYEIRKPLISYHEHNEMTRAPELLISLEQGAKIALVSDAGMPLVSDPGHRLVTLCLRHHVPVVPVPGPSALLASLAASGLPNEEFLFVGFLPARTGERRRALERLRIEDRTIILYEAPHRILDTLADLEAVFGPGLRIVLARELTKIHEEFLRGAVSEVRTQMAARDRVRGEITLLVLAPASTHADTGAAAEASIAARVARLQSEFALDEMEALKRLARELGRSKSELYRELQREHAARRKRL